MIRKIPIPLLRFHTSEEEEEARRWLSVKATWICRTSSTMFAVALSYVFWYIMYLQHSGAHFPRVGDLLVILVLFVFGVLGTALYTLWIPISWFGFAYMFWDYTSEGMFQSVSHPGFTGWLYEMVQSATWRGLPGLLSDLFFLSAIVFTLPVPGSDGWAVCAVWVRRVSRLKERLEFTMVG